MTSTIHPNMFDEILETQAFDDKKKVFFSAFSQFYLPHFSSYKNVLRCKTKRSGENVPCSHTGDNTTQWPVEVKPKGAEVGDGWRVDLATDERGQTAAVILYLRNKHVVELLKWNDLR